MSDTARAAEVHKVQVWTQAGPAGGSASGASCATCGWRTGKDASRERDDVQRLADEHARSTTPASVTLAVVEPAPVGPGTTLAAWSGEQIDIIRRSVAPECSDDELAFFSQVCRHRGLDPFAGEICAVMRWSSKAKRKVMTIQETAAGLRAIAGRSGLYAGQDQPQWCGPDGAWRDVWLDTAPPTAAKVAVYRSDWARPAVGIALYGEFAQLDDHGKATGLWRSHPTVMLAKTAERQALIRAFTSQMAHAGVNTTELTTASRISMEGRRVGLDTAARHELVADVTGGRTESTRDLTDAEVFEVRAAIAQLGPEDGGYVDEDGVIHVPEPEGTQAGPGDNPESPERRPTPSPEAAEPPAPETPDPHHEFRARLTTSARRLNDVERAEFRAWLDTVGIGADTKVRRFTEDQLHAVDVYLDQAAEEPF